MNAATTRLMRGTDSVRRDGQLRIGELAQRTGVSAKALRIYDRLGLVVGATRSESNYRLFTEEAVACVSAIRVLLAAGVRLGDLHRMSSGYRAGADPRELLLRVFEQALARLDRQIEQRQASRRELLRLIQHPPIC